MVAECGDQQHSLTLGLNFCSVSQALTFTDGSLGNRCCMCVPLFPVLFPGENESFQRSFSKVCGLISPVKWDRKARGGGDWEEISSPKGDATPPKPYHLKGDPLLWRRHWGCFTNITLLIMVPKPQKTLSWFFIVRSWSGSWRQKPPKREGPSWTVASRKFSLSP